jgi:hypothetical protein
VSKHIVVLTDENLRVLMTIIRKEARRLGYEEYAYYNKPKSEWPAPLLRLNRASKPIFDALYPSKEGDAP